MDTVNVSLPLFAVAAVAALLLASCSVFVEGSLERSNEKESGMSPVAHQEKWGYSAGAVLVSAPHAAENSFLIATKMEFVQKGSENGDDKARLNYLEIHPDVLYAHPFISGSQIFGGLGPYLAYGVGGKEGSGPDAEASFTPHEYKRLDGGLNLQAGYQLANSLRITMAYDYGLIDKSQDPPVYLSHNRSYSINLGYSVNRIIGAFRKK